MTARVLAVVLATLACGSPAPRKQAPLVVALPPPRALPELDASTQAAFIAAFDEAEDRPRLVVALSPT